MFENQFYEVTVYVWAFEQEGRHFSSQDVFIPWSTGASMNFEESKMAMQENSCEKTKNPSLNGFPEGFHQNGASGPSESVLVRRYYHMFKKGELEDLFGQLGDVFTISKSFYEHTNWCVIAKKNKRPSWLEFTSVFSQ